MNAERTARLDRLLANELDVAFRRRARWLLDALELDADPACRVLDLGCGAGWYLHALARLYPELDVTGADADPAKLAAAERLGTGARLEVADAQALPLPDASVDRVLMSEVLEHLPDDAAALREVRRVLRPGGILALSVPHARYPFLYDPVGRVWAAAGGAPIRRGPLVGIWTNHERLYEPDALGAAIRAAGLDVDRLEEATHHAFPFTALLVYGVGKPLLEHGLVPAALARSSDRFRGEDNPGTAWNPVNAARRAFDAVDRLNERSRARHARTWVNVLARARRPAGPAGG